MKFRDAPWTWGLAAAAIGVACVPGLATWLQGDAESAGQWWRLFSAHWTHWSWNHLVWDVSTFLVLGIIAETASPARFGATTCLSALVIAVGVRVSDPALLYRGLSGIDSALFMLVAVMSWRRWPVASTLAIAAFVAKTAYEVVSGNTLFVDSQLAAFEPVPIAHLLGAIVGACAALGFVAPIRLHPLHAKSVT